MEVKNEGKYSQNIQRTFETHPLKKVPNLTETSEPKVLEQTAHQKRHTNGEIGI